MKIEQAREFNSLKNSIFNLYDELSEQRKNAIDSVMKTIKGYNKFQAEIRDFIELSVIDYYMKPDREIDENIDAKAIIDTIALKFTLNLAESDKGPKGKCEGLLLTTIPKQDSLLYNKMKEFEKLVRKDIIKLP